MPGNDERPFFGDNPPSAMMRDLMPRKTTGDVSRNETQDAILRELRAIRSLLERQKWLPDTPEARRIVQALRNSQGDKSNG